MLLGPLPKHQETHQQVEDGQDGDFPYSELASRLILVSLALCFGPVPRHKADSADRLQQEEEEEKQEEEVEEEEGEEGEGSNKIT